MYWCTTTVLPIVAECQIHDCWKCVFFLFFFNSNIYNGISHTYFWESFITVDHPWSAPLILSSTGIAAQISYAYMCHIYVHAQTTNTYMNDMMYRITECTVITVHGKPPGNPPGLGGISIVDTRILHFTPACSLSRGVGGMSSTGKFWKISVIFENLANHHVDHMLWLMKQIYWRNLLQVREASAPLAPPPFHPFRCHCYL